MDELAKDQATTQIFESYLDYFHGMPTKHDVIEVDVKSRFQTAAILTLAETIRRANKGGFESNGSISEKMLDALQGVEKGLKGKDIKTKK